MQYLNGAHIVKLRYNRWRRYRERQPTGPAGGGATLTSSNGAVILFGILEASLSFTFGKIYHKNWEISTKIHEIGKIKTIFGLGMTPI